MPRTRQIINKDRPFNMAMLTKCPRMRDFLLHTGMRGIVFPWVRLARIDKHEAEPLISKSLRHWFERWRRQRTIRSRERPKLDHHIPISPIIAQTHRLTRIEQDSGKVWRKRTNMRARGKAVEVSLA